MNSKKQNALDLVVKIFSVVTVYVVLVSYGVNVAYYSGYLSEFGVNINMVNYWPSLYDFMVRSVAVLSAVVASTLMFILCVVVINIVARYIKKREWKWVSRAAEGLITPRRYLFSGTVILVMILTFTAIYYIPENMGRQDAITQRNFTRVNELSSATTNSLLVYQNANMGIVKIYDRQADKFIDGYKLVNLVGLSFELIVIK